MHRAVRGGFGGSNHPSTPRVSCAYASHGTRDPDYRASLHWDSRLPRLVGMGSGTVVRSNNFFCDGWCCGDREGLISRSRSRSACASYPEALPRSYASRRNGSRSYVAQVLCYMYPGPMRRSHKCLGRRKSARDLGELRGDRLILRHLLTNSTKGVDT